MQVQVLVHVQLQVLYCVPVADAEAPSVCPHCTPVPVGACAGAGALLYFSLLILTVIIITFKNIKTL